MACDLMHDASTACHPICLADRNQLLREVSRSADDRGPGTSASFSRAGQQLMITLMLAPAGSPVMTALALALHILGAVVWVGGMFAIYVCLRPALGTLEPPQRLRLMRVTFQ